MSEETKLKVVRKKPVYEPEKSYQWNPDDVFPITGAQLDLINKVVVHHLQDPIIQKALGIVEAAKIVNSIIADGVAEGTIKEAVKEETSA